MKEIKLLKRSHNGIKCYKDQTNLFMVVKDERNKKWTLCIADSDEFRKFILENRWWGFNRYESELNTLQDVKDEIENILTSYRGLSYYFNDYCVSLATKEYDL